MLDAAGIRDAVFMSDRTTFVYSGLASDCIRLVRILPQSQDDPTSALRCTIRDFHLDDLPAYTALYYAWGWIFVDAMSINQMDDAERSYQVSLMSRIYSGATQVLAWLGPQYAASDLAMRELGRRAAYWQKRRNMLAIWSSPSGAAIRALCSRPYWSRLWVFQELSLAKKVQLVCGTATVSWSAFSKFILAMRSVVLTPRVGAMFEYQAMCMSPAIKMVQHASNQPGSTALWDLMFGLDYLRCAEPRDKVYALLGVAASAGPNLQPNYHISLPEMLNMVLKYRHATKPPRDIEEVITQCAELEILVGVETGTMFMMKGQHGQYPVPPDDDVAAVTFALPESSISLWWASFYGHGAAEDLLIASGRFKIDQELITAVKENCRARLKMLLVLKQTKTEDVVLGVRVRGYRSAAGRPYSLTLLGFAIHCRHSDIAELLLGTGYFDVNAAVDDQLVAPYYPLHLAISQNNVAMVKVLLGIDGIDINKDRLGRTALEVVMQEVHQEADERYTPNKGELVCLRRKTRSSTQIMELLLGAENVRIPCYAMHICRDPVVGKLLLDAGADCGDFGEHGTALQWAIKGGEGCTGMVQLLLDTISDDVELKGSTPDYTALHWARACLTTMEVLISSGRFDPNLPNPATTTLLTAAAYYGNQVLTQILLESKDLDVDAEDGLGPTALQTAVRQGHREIARMSLDTGKIDLSRRGDAILLDAVMYGDEDVVRAVINSGVVELKPGLQQAATYGRQEIAEMLLDNCANQLTQDDFTELSSIATISDEAQFAKLVKWWPKHKPWPYTHQKRTSNFDPFEGGLSGFLCRQTSRRIAAAATPAATGPAPTPPATPPATTPSPQKPSRPQHQTPDWTKMWDKREYKLE
ncbi:hypothetical protein LTR27_010131 [Elasticomyces elasticus]|nr:hypothetical protein LTR27_010131 [Elasticomyces elasticus]